jgi:hypothetical protein
MLPDLTAQLRALLRSEHADDLLAHRPERLRIARAPFRVRSAILLNDRANLTALLSGQIEAPDEREHAVAMTGLHGRHLRSAGGLRLRGGLLGQARDGKGRRKRESSTQNEGRECFHALTLLDARAPRCERKIKK